MFQRIKGAIDSRIAEEQARQKAIQDAAALSRSNSGVRRTRSRADSRSARLRRDNGNGNALPAKGPDPAEFDAEFVVGDDETSSRTSTPVQPADGGPESNNFAESEGKRSVDTTRKNSMAEEPGQTPPELPTEVRVKLRRLDKLEGRYQELLKAYRIAHARVLSIEPFEASLRENTPLTSIGDPRALTEYLNQITLKGDMVIDELKRVTTDRDDYKKKLAEAEESAQEAHDELASLKKQAVNGKRPLIDTSATREDSGSLEAPIKSPTLSITSRASIPGISIFSPKAKAVTSPPPVEESEEFFSFDNEIPRLESELSKRQEEVDTLKSEVKTLKGDLSVARESTEGMAQSLESATRELIGLRENKDRFKADLESQRKSLEGQISELNSKLSVAEADLKKSTAAMEDLKAQLEEKTKELQQASQEAEGRSQEDQDAESADRAAKLAIAEEQKASGEKRLTILQGIVTNLKSQLKDAENTISSLKSEVSSKEAEAKGFQKIVDFVDDGFKDNETWKTTKKRLSDGQTADFDALRNSLSPIKEPTPAAPAAPAPTTGGKKKNKKKKKGGKGGAEEAAESAATPIQESSTPASSATVAALEKQIENLTSQLADKEAAINRLDAKLKGEEGLKEEIDSLRDDLRDIGQDFVEAKDKVKVLTTEKAALEKTIEGLEKELIELRTSSTSGSADAESLAAEFEELKIKATGLQTDLSAAQQLAASRFKDLTDLRATLQKFQPELRNLRAESAELKTSKEELKNRANELNRLERLHEDISSEMKTLKGKTAEQESEIKALNQKVAQETNSRVKAEQALDVAQSDLRYSESKKQEAIETNQQTAKALAKTQEELRTSRTKLREVEEQVIQLNRDIEGLRDEIQLKTAQHASAQSLMGSMRDQTSEMAMQVKEARERCDSLEEEVADAHRLLSERTREGETMRRLLSDVEIRTDAKVRDFKERLETAIEERDRAEDEANLAGRKRSREIEELKTKARDAERALRRAEQDREELEQAQKDWKRRREDMEAETERSKRDLIDVQTAMTQLRDALDESEKQARDLEKEKAELRRSVEETSQRLEKLRKSNKTLTDDLKAFQASKRRGFDSSNSSGRSPRSSLDRSGVVSPHSRERSATPTGPGAGGIDYVYLKNVLLQFLEQKDKNYQKQLIPVLGMLLHFDT
ncbi:hypothetical protein FQN51_004164 [Onygenales sp. PD_10]|nr:hypothetical protein FQN51_004164 [Onygenales sp. PD_10]